MLNEAVQFIRNMPIEPHVSTCQALLNSCKMYNNVELGEYALNKITMLRPTVMVPMFFYQTSTVITEIGRGLVLLERVKEE
jgi:hypothetical protein